MRALVRVLPVVLLVVFATSAFGQIVPGDPSSYPSVSVVNTPHNLNNFPGVTPLPNGQICIACHTPHNALLAGDENVLWNHEETGATFGMYKSTAGQPEGPSKMCLSCHDGVTAIDSYGGTTSAVPIPLPGTSTANLGIDLTDDHPIGIEYPTGMPFEYNDPAGFAPGINSGPGVILVELGGVDRVECTSCHHVHNNGLGMFLRAPIEESYLCLQCHIK